MTERKRQFSLLAAVLITGLAAAATLSLFRHPVTAEYLASRLMERTPAFLDAWQAPAPMESGLDAAERESLEEALRALGYIE